MSAGVDAFAALREIDDHQKRGYRFEQLVREILPWSLRPPIAVSAKSEQLDAFFEFNSWHFLVECKAGREKITAGSPDWEDLELKLRRRGGGCIGLFCTLGPLDPAIYDAADALNRISHTTIIIAGSQWDDVISEGLSFPDFLRFLVMRARSIQTSRAPSVRAIRDELSDVRSVNQRIRNILQKGSATFLRRHRSPRHDRTYVSRAVDRDIASLMPPLQPDRLRHRERTVQRGDVEFQKARVAPTQIVAVRDLSGAGKTTLSVQLAGQQTGCLCLARAALEPSMDCLSDFLEAIGPSFGLPQLGQINQPVIYAIDSLDECSSLPHKRTEFRSLMKLLAELNSVARNSGYLCFPVLLIFTIREEYWRDWESQFEGSRARLLTKCFSYFTPPELDQALEFYTKAYHFSLEGKPAPDLLDALAHPFTLQVYAEANEYAGAVDVSRHMGFRVLSLFFERKKEDALKRQITGYTGQAMMRICSKVASFMVDQKNASIPNDRLGAIIRDTEPFLASQWREVIRSLLSEQIFVTSDAEPGLLRFRHSRFIEYQIAYYIQQRLLDDGSVDFISAIHEKIASTGFASPHIVIDNLKELTAGSPGEAERVHALFAQSRQYMASLIQQVRSNLGHGIPLELKDANAIKLAISDRDPELCWHAFFALAAFGSGQDNATVLDAFRLAWDANLARSDVWKLISKLDRHSLLLHEEVLRRVAKAAVARVWLVYLDEVSKKYAYEFSNLWNEFGGDLIERELGDFCDNDWTRVTFELSYLKRGLSYPMDACLPQSVIYS